jgi:hypothetical protein
MNESFTTVTEANAYMATKLESETWTSATTDRRSVALIEATRLINRLRFSGVRTSTSQTLQFPRNGETSIPDQVKWATVELALALLNGIDPETEIRNIGRTSDGFIAMKITYNRQAVPVHIAAGIVSKLAWDFIAPYLADPNSVALCRGS